MAWIDLLVFIAGIVLDYYFGLWSRVLSAVSWVKSFFVTAETDVKSAVTTVATDVSSVAGKVSAATAPASTTTATK